MSLQQRESCTVLHPLGRDVQPYMFTTPPCGLTSASFRSSRMVWRSIDSFRPGFIMVG
jgi:hypothetical protein